MCISINKNSMSMNINRYGLHLVLRSRNSFLRLASQGHYAIISPST